MPKVNKVTIGNDMIQWMRIGMWHCTFIAVAIPTLPVTTFHLCINNHFIFSLSHVVPSIKVEKWTEASEHQDLEGEDHLFLVKHLSSITDASPLIN